MKVKFNLLNLFSFIVLLFLSVLHLEATKTIILLDNSGSMMGFYRGNQYISLARIISEHVNSNDILYFQFNQNGPEPLIRAEDSIPSRNDTLIDRALEEVISQNSPDIVWILTDNYQDAPGINQGDIESFYKRLQDKDVKRINIFPVSIQFNGNLILYCDEQGFPDNTPRAVPYNGKKGIVIYSILINDEFKADYENDINEIENQLDFHSIESERLLCKPLEEETIELEFCETPKGRPESNLEYKPLENIFYGDKFKEGQPIFAFFYCRLKSKFNHLRIVKAELEGRPKNGFKTLGFHKPEVKSEIVPSRLEDLEPGEYSSFIYEVRVEIEKLKIKKDISSLLRAAFKDKGYAEGRMELVLDVLKESFQFTDEILRNYNTQDTCDTREENLKKIYQIGGIIPKMSTETVKIPVSYDIRMDVQYPKWPLFLLIVLILFLGFFMFLTYKLIASIGGVQYEVSVDEGEPLVFGLMLFMSKTIKIEESDAIKFQKRFSMKVVAKALENYSIEEKMKTKALEKEDTFSLIGEEGESYFIRFTTLSQKKERAVDEEEDYSLPGDEDEADF